MGLELVAEEVETLLLELEEMYLGETLRPASSSSSSSSFFIFVVGNGVIRGSTLLSIALGMGWDLSVYALNKKEDGKWMDMK
jgi:hypothetical protein